MTPRKVGWDSSFTVSSPFLTEDIRDDENSDEHGWSENYYQFRTCYVKSFISVI